MKNKFLYLLLLFICLFSSVSAQKSNTDRATAYAYELGDKKVKLDGKLTESVWKLAPVIDSFVQREPFQGQQSTDKIEVQFVYSKSHLYLSGRVYKDPKTIQAIVSRRDNSASSERLIFTFDTYLDRITSYSFGITAAAVRLDYIHPSDNPFNRDRSWNPVWRAKANIDSLGWTLEAKIPFSQLRFNDIEELIFGLNINHYVPNTNEDSFWIMIPRDEVGWASHFGDLKGIEGVSPGNRIEVLPYVASDILHKGEFNADNPFDEQTVWNRRIGADFKIGVTPFLTVDATVNPDFGQVEADPAVVNLSQFEVVQAERRPFFTEGSALFRGNGPNYFYSRRIGSIPAFTPSEEGGFVSASGNTTILSAAKLTGRLDNGLSVAVLSALTANEYATTFDSTNNSYDEVKVEPLTSYNVMRLQQEFGEYGSRVGFSATGVNRDLKMGSHLDDVLNRNAFTGGLDWRIRLDKRKYEVNGALGFSTVHGSRNKITDLQQSSARLYQRPDANHVEVDSTLTNLTGFTGNLEFNKVEGNLTWGIRSSYESPGFELNDVGLVRSVDNYSYNLSINYRQLDPTDWYNQFSISGATGGDYNTGHIRKNTWIWMGTNLTTPSFARFNFNMSRWFGGLSDNITRGGPLMERPGGGRVRFSAGTNRALATNVDGGIEYATNEEGRRNFNTNVSFSTQFGSQIDFRISPRFSWDIEKRQYITTQETQRSNTFGNRYIFATVERQTISMSVRLNYAITPDLSLEMYAEPFVSNGIFSEFGELEAARTNRLRYYGEDGTTFNVDADGNYQITDGAESFSIDNRDFKVASFRSNFVLRYEWKPGSTIFFVWQQNRFTNAFDNNTLGANDLFNSLTAIGNQVVAIKASFWFYR